MLKKMRTREEWVVFLVNVDIRRLVLSCPETVGPP